MISIYGRPLNELWSIYSPVIWLLNTLRSFSSIINLSLPKLVEETSSGFWNFSIIFIPSAECSVTSQSSDWEVFLTSTTPEVAEVSGFLPYLFSSI